MKPDLNRARGARIRRCLLALLLLVCTIDAPAADTATPAFKADDALSENARRWAEEFVAFAAGRYEVELDFSEVSIKYIDDIAADVHKTYVEESPPDEMVRPIARALGSYVAEVYRYTHGGDWGWVTVGDVEYPGVAARSGATFLPMKRAEDRIRKGAEFDIWDYYQLLGTQ